MAIDYKLEDTAIEIKVYPIDDGGRALLMRLVLNYTIRPQQQSKLQERIYTASPQEVRQVITKFFEEQRIDQDSYGDFFRLFEGLERGSFSRLVYYQHNS